jgi:ubiquinone/menaquinone biosynthesis C-methylase UbiE
MSRDGRPGFAGSPRVGGFSRLGARFYAWFNRDPESNRLVTELAELVPSDRVLDVGCGPGAAVARAADVVGAEQVAAVDPSPAFVRMVGDRVPGADVREAGAETLPFADGTFTVVWSISAMHHWPDRDAGLAEARRVLAPGGRLLIAERLLSRPGHGITTGDVHEVVGQLSSAGVGEVSATEHRIGRKTMLVLRAVART